MGLSGLWLSPSLRGRSVIPFLWVGARCRGGRCRGRGRKRGILRLAGRLLGRVRRGVRRGLGGVGWGVGSRLG